MTALPFAAERHDLGAALLRPLRDGEIAPLAAAMAAIPPWATIGYPVADMEAFFRRADAGTYKFAIDIDGAVLGTVSVRNPFLKGPYLELLAVLPPAQKRGIGAAVLDWMAREAAGSGRNLWLCVSDFNVNARRFYERNGFAETAVLDDLALDGCTEIFMRRRI